MNNHPQKHLLRPAKRKIEEPPEAMKGWRGADISPDELVDDQFIADDPDSTVVGDE